jgi:hypothetical protein
MMDPYEQDYTDILSGFTFEELAERARRHVDAGRPVPAKLKAILEARGGTVDADGFVWAPSTAPSVAPFADLPDSPKVRRALDRWKKGGGA